jgi:hypothetical protein
MGAGVYARISSARGSLTIRAPDGSSRRRGDRMRLYRPKWPIVLLRNLRAPAVSLAAFALFGAFDSATAAEPRCTCRALGRSFELNQSVCLLTSKGPRIAVCVIVLNMTSWQISDTACVGALTQAHGSGGLLPYHSSKLMSLHAAERQ